ncbi:hypothetical protein D3C78_1540840 [compost metagenome]
MHLDQDLVRPHGRVRQFREPGSCRATIVFEHKGFHHLVTRKHEVTEPGKPPCPTQGSDTGQARLIARIKEAVWRENCGLGVAPSPADRRSCCRDQRP